MYLFDTNVISEIRKKQKMNTGVKQLFSSVKGNHIFLSVITIGELRRGVERICHRGDTKQANQLEKWLTLLLNEYQDNILEVDNDVAQLWGKLRTPNPENALDKLIAATAIIYDLTVVTRNEKDFVKTGAKIINPFT